MSGFQEYNSSGLLVKKKNGSAIVDDMKRNLQRILAKKMKSIKVCFRCLLAA